MRLILEKSGRFGQRISPVQKLRESKWTKQQFENFINDRKHEKHDQTHGIEQLNLSESFCHFQDIQEKAQRRYKTTAIRSTSTSPLSASAAPHSDVGAEPPPATANSPPISNQKQIDKQFEQIRKPFDQFLNVCHKQKKILA